jgi:hypothetical protein
MKLFSALIVLFTVLALACFVTEVQASQGAYAAYLVAFIGTAAIAGTMTRSMQMENVSRLYANTLTNLIPDTYAALDVVSRELFGAIPAVMRDSTADRVAQNQNLRIFQTPPNTSSATITPAMSIPAAADQTIGTKTLTIGNFIRERFSWSGEEQYAMNQGPGYLNVKQGQIAQAMRSLVNGMELSLIQKIQVAASRATGTAGTTPFASTLTDPAQTRKILDDNGAPFDRHLIINTTAGAAMRTLAQLTKANEANDSTMLRQGVLLDIHGFAIRESAQIQTPASGGMTGALFNGAGAVGDTTITFDTGTVNTTGIVAGDVITVGSYKYVVATGTTSTSGTFTINAPGLQAVVADNTAITVNSASARNLAFSRNAVLLATRLPSLPEEGDMAVMREIVTDPRSGISFELAVYPGYRMNVYELAIAYDSLVIKPEHVAVLMG